MQAKLNDTEFYPTREDWEKIQTVYNFHPAINGIDHKATIAMLYKVGGMALINDMLPRAKELERIDKEMRSLRNKLSELSDRYDELNRI